MKSCPYCGTEVFEPYRSPLYYCDFCDMLITPASNGERKERYQRKPVITIEDGLKTTPELLTYHTYDLLYLLMLLRQERRVYFSQVHTFKKVSNETQDFKDVEVQAGNEYENITRKVWVVENILCERMGYVPKRITLELLESFVDRMESSKDKKPMTFKKEGVKR